MDHCFAYLVNVFEMWLVNILNNINIFIFEELGSVFLGFLSSMASRGFLLASMSSLNLLATSSMNSFYWPLFIAFSISF